MTYHEVSDVAFTEGEVLLVAAAMGEIPAYEDNNPRRLFELAHTIYRLWRCWRVIREGDHVLIDGVELLAWIDERECDPGWDELEARGFRIMSSRTTPACLIGSFRHILLNRAAAGEHVEIATGEGVEARRTWLVEDGVYQELWRGSEEQWRKELCDPDASDAWPHCRRICHHRPAEC